MWKMDSLEVRLEAGKPVKRPLKSFIQEEMESSRRSGCGDEK